MVIDTSAIVAILSAEPEQRALAQAIAADPVRLMSAATLLQLTLVIESRYGPSGGRELDLLLHRAEVSVVDVTSDQIQVARRAWRSFGKGRHPAALNFGDCFPYALCRTSGEPLLCKGQDFQQTDLPLVHVGS